MVARSVPAIRPCFSRAGIRSMDKGPRTRVERGHFKDRAPFLGHAPHKGEGEDTEGSGAVLVFSSRGRKSQKTGLEKNFRCCWCGWNAAGDSPEYTQFTKRHRGGSKQCVRRKDLRTDQQRCLLGEVWAAVFPLDPGGHGRAATAG